MVTGPRFPNARFTPMRLVLLDEPFDDPDWLWEPKFDGFRALAFVRGGVCRFESRNSNTLTQFPDLARSVARAVRRHDVVLDGEIVCLDAYGRSDFAALMSRSGQTSFYAFDILEFDGHDLRDLSLETRKSRLSGLPLTRPARFLIVDHVEATGRALFEVACEHDLEGIVGKWRHGRYVGSLPTSSWVKVNNHTYSRPRNRGNAPEGGAGGVSSRPVRLELV
jgi:bifunctional non-homologous end joining protein LigD